MTNATIEAQLQALQAKVQTLEQQLAAVSRQLEQVRSQHDSMRDQVRCPACGCRTILHAHKVVDRDQVDRMLAVASKGLWSPKPVGAFEVHVCTNCGLVEWRVKDPSEIEIDGEVVELCEVDDALSGPYR